MSGLWGIRIEGVGQVWRGSAGGLVFLARDTNFTKDLVSLLPWGLGMLFSHLLDLRCLCKYANDVNGQETKQ